MQRYTDPPRQALSEAQVLRLLQGGPRVTVAFGAERVDYALRYLGDVDLLGGTIKRSLYANIHGTCDLELDVELDWATDLLRPWMELSDQGVTARWYLGAFSLTTPRAEYGEVPRTRRVQGYDRLYLLSRQVGDTYVVPAGSKVLSAVWAAIAAAGLTGVLLDGTKQDAVLETDMVWPLIKQVDPELAPEERTGPQQDNYENATTWLRVCNDLLFTIGYRGLYADPATGLFRSEPYIAPEKRAIEHTFDFDDPRNSIVVPQRTLTEDRWKAPNKWVFIRQNMPGSPPRAPVVGDGLYIVDQSAGDPRGLVWPTQIPLDVADQASLVSQGDNRVLADKRVQSMLSVATAPFPAAGHADIFRYLDVAMGKNIQVQAREWSLPLDGSDMTWAWEAVA